MYANKNKQTISSIYSIYCFIKVILARENLHKATTVKGGNKSFSNLYFLFPCNTYMTRNSQDGILSPQQITTTKGRHFTPFTAKKA